MMTNMSDGEKLKLMKKIGMGIAGTALVLGGVYILGTAYILGRFHGAGVALDMVKADMLKAGGIPTELLRLDEAGEALIMWQVLK